MDYLDSQAWISDCGRYRYSLSRRMGTGNREIVFCGLNPSTADAEQDDPTIRREVDYARRWGFDWYHKVNLYAFRSTNPRALLALSDEAAIGPRNADQVNMLAGRSEIILCAWGSAKLHRGAVMIAAHLLQMPTAHYLKLNADGAPGHPLYLPKTLMPQRFPCAPGLLETSHGR